MAKKKGIFSTIGSIFRWVILGLAAVMAFALWQNFNKEDAPVVAEAEPEAPAEETVEVVADEPVSEAEETVETAVTEAETAVETAVAEAEQAVETLQTEAEEAVANATEAAQNMADQAQEQAADAATAAGEALSNLTSQAEEAAEDASEGLANLAEDAEGALGAALEGLAPDTPFEVVERIEVDGGVELTTATTEGDVTNYTVHRINCDPLEVGVIGEGPELDAIQRTETPEMQPVGDDALLSDIAAVACTDG